MTEVEKAAALEKLIASSADYGDTYLSRAVKDAYRVIAPRSALVKAVVEFAVAAGLNHCVITDGATEKRIDILVSKTLDVEIVRFATALLQLPLKGKPVSLSDLDDAGLLSGRRSAQDVNRADGKLGALVDIARAATDPAYRALVTKPVGDLSATELKMICKSVNSGAMRELFAIMAIGKLTDDFAKFVPPTTIAAIPTGFAMRTALGLPPIHTGNAGYAIKVGPNNIHQP